jgi:FlaA1/EpsC-like NDP-sugar epimerase
VPACEYNPIEAVKTNINGAINVIDAALDNSVGKVIVVSSDKAVQRSTFTCYQDGRREALCAGHAYAGGRGTRFSCTRYGNVFASRGSVVELFLQQRENGFVTITDERMTRFWITLEQGVRFVIGCIERMQGEEIFIPRIPSMKVTDVADAVCPGVKRKIIGIRPGEKLHEILLTAEEAAHSREFEDYFVIEPEQPFGGYRYLQDGKRLPEGFEYTSDSNSQWLTKGQLKDMMGAI